jgi:hypothetical protein
MIMCLALVPVGAAVGLAAPSVAAAGVATARAATHSGAETADDCGMSVELVPKCGIWWGAHASIGWAAFESVIGRKLAIVHDYVDWTENFPSANEKLAAAGNRIIFVDWSALNFATGKADTSWEGIANGSQDPIIDAEAAVLKSFGQKIMVTFQAEPEQSVYASYGTAAEYVAAWQHIAARFAAEKVTNVVWVWDVEGDVYDHGSTYQDWYPGDADVDWIMWDPYNWFGCNGDSDPWQTFADIVTPMYNWLTTHSGTAGNGDYLSKPWGLGEYGTIEGASPRAEEQWYESVASEAEAQFPKLKALVYFGSDDTTNGRTCDWEATSSPDSLAGFKDAGNQLYTSPMPYTVYSGTSPQGFWLASADGSVFAAGSAPSLAGTRVPSSDPVVGIASTSDGKGFWLVTANGSVYSFGDARFRGSLPALGVHITDIVAIAPTGDGGGYWIIGRDGGEFAFGDAHYHGSLPGLRIKVTDVVGMVATSNGGGYWIVGSDGGVFAFGDTHYVGSLPGLGVHVDDVRAMIPAPSRDGYVLVGSDGGAFVLGTGVHYYGSLPGEHIHVTDIVGLALTPNTLGYWFAGASGSTYSFGNGENLAVPPSVRGGLPVVSIATS